MTSSCSTSGDDTPVSYSEQYVECTLSTNHKDASSRKQALFKMATKRSGRVSVNNVILLAVVCVVALLFYINLSSSTGTANLRNASGYQTVTLDSAEMQGGSGENEFEKPEAPKDVKSRAVAKEIFLTLPVPFKKETVILHGLKRADLKWHESNHGPYYVVNLEATEDDRYQTKLQTVCRHNIEPIFCDFLFTGPRRVVNMKSAALFLVPIFQSTLFTKDGLYQLIKRLTVERYFIKYRGSDFVFLCYTTSCSDTRNVTLAALGKSVRAMWVDRGGHLKWPCSNRNLDIQLDVKASETVTNWISESQRIQNVFARATKLIEGRDRWNCSSMETWGLRNPSVFDYKTLKDTSFKSVDDKVAYCGVPKVGSSVAVLMMRRMNNMTNWKAENTVQIRNFHAHALNWTFKSHDELYQIFNDTQWVKGMIVRNPISRLLSAYKSKILELHEYNRIPGGGWPSNNKPPTMAQFINRLKLAKLKGNFDWMDRHIRPQSALCGIRTLPYDFVGRYEERQEDLEGFLRSIDLWEKIGESGWGPDSTSSLYAEDERIIRRTKPKPVTHSEDQAVLQKFYTKELITAVIHLYEEDFTRFGYSMNPDDYLGTR